MKIAIISDVHDNKINLEKVLNYCTEEKIKKIICCGDLASMETLDFLCDNFPGKIFYALGNMEEGRINISFLKGATRLSENSVQYKNATIHKTFGETEINGKQIAFIHFPREAKELAATRKYDFVFHGHTHKPWVEKIRECTLLNPGNVTGDFYPPTFATWNTENDKFELLKIHDLR